MSRTKSKTPKLVRLSDKQIANLEQLAKDKDYNLSEAIRYVIDNYFDNLQPKHN